MKTHLLRSLALLAFGALLTLTLPRPAHAQEVTNAPADTKNAVSLDTGLASAVVARASYSRGLPLGEYLADARLVGRLTWPLASPDLQDMGIDLGMRASVLRSGNWRLQLALGPTVHWTKNPQFTGTGIGARAVVLPGYQEDRFGVMVELAYEKALTTHISQSEEYTRTMYPGARDGWYALPGGTLLAGLRGGVRLGSFEIFSTAGLQKTETFGAATPPFYGTIGATYAF